MKEKFDFQLTKDFVGRGGIGGPCAKTSNASGGGGGGGIEGIGGDPLMKSLLGDGGALLLLIGIAGLITVGLKFEDEEILINFLAFGSSLLMSNRLPKVNGALLRCGEKGSDFGSDHGSELLGVLRRSKSSSKPLST